MKILQWKHFVPGYDKWFNDTYVKEWGAKHNTNVMVDNIGLAEINSRAAAEVSAQKGHDLCMFQWPAAVHEDQVIDHRDICEECERKYGKALDLAIKNTYNPKTRKFYGFSDSYVPEPINYRKDLWDAVGTAPDTWEDIWRGGRKIKLLHDKAKPPEKYKVLEDALDWVTNIGYPGYANAAIDEIFNTWVLSTMFAQAATGKLSPEEALNQADAQVQRIFQKWRERGKI